MPEQQDNGEPTRSVHEARQVLNTCIERNKKKGIHAACNRDIPAAHTDNSTHWAKANNKQYVHAHDMQVLA